MKLTIIAHYHPAAALHQPRLWADMLNDWANLPEKVEADYVVVEPSSATCWTGNPFVALDTENAPDGGLGQWSIASRDPAGQLTVMPFYGAQKQIDFKQRILACSRRVIMHNAKWDLRVLKRAGMKEPDDVVDTMILAYCLGLGKQNVSADVRYADAGMIGGLGLKYLARRHLGMEMQTWEEVKDHPEQVPEYNAKDSVATYLLWEKWLPKIPKFFWDIDMPLLRVLMAMEDRGIKIDPTKVVEYGRHLDEEIVKIDLGGINPFSNKQVADYVYSRLGVEPWQFTASGQPSTEQDVLETIDDPLVKKILEYKKLYKERGTYVKNYVEAMDIDGRIHPEFKQCSTATSRLSAANPPVQNVPVEKSSMRSIFVAVEGKSLVRVDWKQLEVIFLAVHAGVEEMLEVFNRGEDIHQWVADQLNIDRYPAKKVTFRIQYGGDAWGLSRDEHIPIDDAKELFAKYFKRFPGVKRYIDEMRAICEEKKEVSLWTGRKRRMDAMYASDWRVREQGIREGINTPIQGGSGEIVKLAMIDLHYKHAAPLILQVHDELLNEVPDKDAVEYAQWLKEYVPTITEYKGMRFPVDTSVGKNWLECLGKEVHGNNC